MDLKFQKSCKTILTVYDLTHEKFYKKYGFKNHTLIIEKEFLIMLMLLSQYLKIQKKI